MRLLWAFAWVGLGAFASGANWPVLTMGTFIGAGQLVRPVYLTHAGDGTGRLFVIEQRGTVRIIQNGSVVATPFLNITNRVLLGTGMGDERGCLGLAFPPDFSNKRHFYVYYFATGSPAETRLSRFHLTGNDHLADPNSEQILLRITQPQGNHNGGQLMFGPDGYLYLAVGDGGSSNDEGTGHATIGNAQYPLTLLGKMLRLDVESPPITNAYQIPPTNPFFGNTNFLPEIWAYGLRNPYRCSFDRLTGDLWIGDVGQGAVEEVNFEPAGHPGGRNYGWRRYEGNTCTARVNDPPCGSNTNSLVFPVGTYAHTAGRCSLTGGYVHRGAPFWSFLHGAYVYGDYCTGEIWLLKPESAGWTNRMVLDSSFLISGFGEDEIGQVYVLNLSNGEIRRLQEIPVDSDTDSLPDAYEHHYGMNTNSAADAALDVDGDGLSALQEFVAGTDPTNALSRLVLDELVTQDANQVLLQWPSVAGRRYGIHGTTNLAEAFVSVASNLPATPPLNQFTATTETASHFYTLDARTNSP